MVTILKKGIPPSERKYKIECHNCDTIFEFKASEGKLNWDNRDGNYYSISCPICNQFLTINK